MTVTAIATTKHAARYHKEEPPVLCEQCGGCLACRETRRAGSCVSGPDCRIEGENDQPEPVTVAPALTGRLEGDALTARKRLAAAGRNDVPGTTFGSRWTDAEREELQALYDEHGRRDAVRLFIEAHPHRTIEGARYQIDRNLSKRA